MVFLLLALPIGLVCGYVAFLAWRCGHLKVALGMGLFSGLCLLIGAVPILFAWLYTKAPAVQF